MSKTRGPAQGDGPLILGDSRALREAMVAALRVAASSINVLLTGETGTGKGLLAELIHCNSGRAGPLVKVTCPNLHEGLAESQLFGHARGAFTGATRDHNGYLSQAHRGTLFLDEIGDLAPVVQAKLLNAIQDQRFRRLGEVDDQEVDLRVVCATHRDVGHMTTTGAFREDFYTRVVHYRIVVPPLRERGKDVIVLARHVLATHVGLAQVARPRLTRAAERFLLRYPWPGNVRELESVLLQAGIDAEGRPLTDAMLEAAVVRVGLRRGGPAPGPALGMPAASSGRRAGGLAGGSRLEKGARRAAGAVLSPGPGIWSEEHPLIVAARAVHPRGPAAVRLVVERGRIQRAELLHATELSERTGDRLLGALVDAGVLQRDGRHGRAAGYLLAPRWRRA